MQWKQAPGPGDDNDNGRRMLRAGDWADAGDGAKRELAEAVRQVARAGFTDSRRRGGIAAESGADVAGFGQRAASRASATNR